MQQAAVQPFANHRTGQSGRLAWVPSVHVRACRCMAVSRDSAAFGQRCGTGTPSRERAPWFDCCRAHLVGTQTLPATEQTTAGGTLWFHAQSPSKKPRAERIGLKASSPSSESEPSFSSLMTSSSSSLSCSSFRSAASASGTSLEHPGSDFCGDIATPFEGEIKTCTNLSVAALIDCATTSFVEVLLATLKFSKKVAKRTEYTNVNADSRASAGMSGGAAHINGNEWSIPTTVGVNVGRVLASGCAHEQGARRRRCINAELQGSQPRPAGCAERLGMAGRGMAGDGRNEIQVKHRLWGRTSPNRFQCLSFTVEASRTCTCDAH